MSLETMTKLATVTVGAGGSATIDFSNIPQTYTDLCVLMSLRSDRSAIDSDAYIKLNNTTTGYSYRFLYSDPNLGTPVGNSSGSTYPMTVTNAANATASTFANSRLYISNYTSSNYKSMAIEGVSENNSIDCYTYTVAGLWSNTAAVNQITITPYTGSFVQYTTATLYGVKAARTAVGNSIKATGGNIAFDGTYVFHTFNTTSSFTPTTNLTADILVVAGGGGAGAYFGAGGGGGGLLEFTSQTLASGNSYVCTVGAGAAGVTSNGNGNSGNSSQFGSLTATVGGGAGGGGVSGGNGSTGGSGGGGGQTGTAGSGTAGQGYAGYTFNASQKAGGGGGAGAAATNANGGNGKTSSFINSIGSGTGAGETVSGNTYFAGGGGGAPASAQYGTGGYGGGGSAANGKPNTGGGGGSDQSAGGSGIIVVRYKA